MPNVSFSDKFEAPSGYAEVVEVEPPIVNEFQTLEEIDPELINGVYYQKYIVKNIDIDDAKNIKRQEISYAFNKEFSEGTLNSSLGFVADCRRDGIKFDKDNLQSLISIGNFPIMFKDSNGEIHSLSENDSNILLQEMVEKGLWCYQHKWELEELINNTTNINDLLSIKWSV